MQEYTSRRRWLRWGINLLERLPCGELLCGERYFAEILMIALPGILLLCFVGILKMNSAGDRKNFAEDDLSVVIC